MKSIGPVIDYMWTEKGGGLSDDTYTSGWMAVMYVTRRKGRLVGWSRDNELGFDVRSLGKA